MESAGSRTEQPERPGPVAELNIFSLLNSLLRHPKALIGIPIVAMIIITTATLIRGPYYISESIFTPQVSQGSGSGLAALALQFGIGPNLPQGGPPIDFYAELIRSQEFLGQVALSRFSLGEEDGNGPYEGDLVRFFSKGGSNEAEQVRKTVEHLQKRIKIRRDPRANLVTVQIQAPRADLAEMINRRLLDLLETFNRERRQSQASSERKFVEARMGQALEELQGAEAVLKAFHEGNIGYEISATLRLEAARLQRRVDQRQQVYSSLAQAFEQARIDEVRDTPVITLVMSPEGWVRRHRGLIKNAVLGMILGVVLAVGAIFGGVYLGKQKADDPEAYREFQVLRRFRSSRQ